MSRFSYLPIAGLGFILAVGLAGIPLAGASGTDVRLRVEGPNGTLLEKSVTASDAQQIRGNACPGPNALTALDSGTNGDWDGTYYSSFGDYFVTKIKGVEGDSSHFWELIKNFRSASAGGCSTPVSSGNEILWAFATGSEAHILQLCCDGTITTAQALTVVVSDGNSGDGVDGASVVRASDLGSVGANDTGSDGKTNVTFSTPADYRLKAVRSDSIRSNAITVHVTSSTSTTTTPTTTTNTTSTTQTTSTSPLTNTTSTSTSGSGGGSAGSGTQGTDYDPPVVRIVGLANHGKYEQGPRTIQGLARDESGLEQVFVRLIRIRDGECSWFSAARRRFNHSCHPPRFVPVGDRTLWRLVLGGRLGRGLYILQVRARDKNGNAYPSTDDGRSRIRFEVMG